jgi:hypothetical protein
VQRSPAVRKNHQKVHKRKLVARSPVQPRGGWVCLRTRAHMRLSHCVAITPDIFSGGCRLHQLFTRNILRRKSTSKNEILTIFQFLCFCGGFRQTDLTETGDFNYRRRHETAEFWVISTTGHETSGLKILGCGVHLMERWMT